MLKVEIETDSSRETAKEDESATTINEIEFCSGNPTVETIKGVVRFYRLPLAGASKDEERLPVSRQVMLLDIPSLVSTVDLVDFISPFAEEVLHIRILRNDVPDSYFALIDFSSVESARDFYSEFQGQKYSDIDTGECTPVFVAAAKCYSSTYKDKSTREKILLQDLTLSPTSRDCAPPVASMASSAAGAVIDDHAAREPSSGGGEISSLTPPPVELPTCPICIDRLDPSASGIITVLCNHSFHAECISRWELPTCPVCRFVQQPQGAEVKCSECGQSDDLWICLVCSYVGCGRYSGGHAKAHCVDTGHTFFLHMQTRCVWDYASDHYVHRLLQNSVDGKPVEQELFGGKGGDKGGGAGTAGDDKHGVAVSGKEDLQMDFENLLLQLEEQHAIYESRIAGLQAEAKEAGAELEAVRSLLSKEKIEKKKLASERSKLQRQQTRTETALERQRARNKEQAQKLLTQQQVNKYLGDKRIELSGQLSAEKRRCEELRQQVHDLAVHLDMVTRVERGTIQPGAAGGSVAPPPP